MSRKPETMVPILLVLTTFFSYGCTAAQRHEILMDAKGILVEELKTQLPKLKDAAVTAATEFAEKRIREQQEKQLASIDVQLAQFKTMDPETGAESSKTWKDFDADKDGQLAPLEQAKVVAFITAQVAKKVASGEMTKEEGARTTKSVGYSLAGLMALWLLSKGTTLAAKKVKGGTPAVVSSPPGAGPPAGGESA